MDHVIELRAKHIQLAYTFLAENDGGEIKIYSAIKIEFDRKDGPRKRRRKAHLAECAGTICYKMGELSKAVDYLNASIALYPDAGAYINLAKAYERMILCGVAEDSDKDLIVRTIRDLCRHAEKLDLKDEHKEDLDYFKRVCLGREKGSSGSPGDGQMAGEAKAGDSGGKWGGAAKNCG